jgi:hypothetical protein
MYVNEKPWREAGQGAFFDISLRQGFGATRD